MDNYKFVVFKDPVIREGNPSKKKIFDMYECVFLPEEQADYWLDRGPAVRNLWICNYCGASYFQKKCPYKCDREDCDNTREKAGFDNIHPQKHYEMSSVMDESFNILSVRENRSSSGFGKLYVYDDGVYREEQAVGFLKEMALDACDRKRNTWRNEVIHDLADMNQISRDELGLEGPKVAVSNGILNIETEQLEDFAPDKYALNKIPHDYDPDAECEQFENYLDEWIPNKRSQRHLQELLGTALHPEKLHKKMGILLGPTDAGKSTFLELIRHVLGKDNVEAQGPHSLSGRWGVDKIFDCLLNAADEVRGSEKLENVEKLKKIADGNETPAEEKGVKTYSFEPTCEHIYGANVTPDADRGDKAFWNRWITIEFPKEIPEEDQEKGLIDDLKKEAPGILNWLIEGYQRFSENGNSFTDPLHWKESKKMWLEWGSALQRFIQQFVEEGSGHDRISKQELFNQIQTFAEEKDLPAPDKQRDVVDEFKKLTYADYGRFTIDGSRSRGFKNLKITYTPEPKREVEESIIQFYDENGYVPDDGFKKFLDSFCETHEFERDEVETCADNLVKEGDISLDREWVDVDEPNKLGGES